MRAPYSDENLDDLRMRFYRAMREDRLWLSPTLSLDTLARRLGSCGDHVVAMLRREGKTLRNELLRYRIDEVKRIVETEPHLPNREVARRSGFGSANNLCVCFRKSVGMTISEYRRGGTSASG